MGFVTGDGGAGALVRVRVRPGARRDEIAGERAGALLVHVTAPPVEGRANVALCRLLARFAGTKRATVVRGAKSRDKVVRIEGVSADDLARRLGA